MAFVAISAGVGIAATAYNVVDSVNKNAAAKKLGESNTRPAYNAPPEIDEVKQLAASEVNNTYLEDSVMRNLAQSQSQGIDAILKSGGKADFSTIHNTYGTQLTAALQTLYKDRDQKIATYNSAAYASAQANDAEFQYNKDAPFKDKKQQEATLRQQSAQAASAAFSTAASTVSNLGIAKAKQGQYGTQDPNAPNTAQHVAEPVFEKPQTMAQAYFGNIEDLRTSVNRNNLTAPAQTTAVTDFYGGYHDENGNWISTGG